MRVAVVTSHPVQYIAPFFRYLTEKSSLDLTVLYLSRLGTAGHAEGMENFGRRVVWDIDLLDGYRHKFLPDAEKTHPQRRKSMKGFGLVDELTPGRYDVVVNVGWAYPADWLSFALSVQRHLPFLLYGDTDVRDRGTTVRGGLRKVVMNGLCRRAAGALYTGTFNRDFYIAHGMDPERLWFSPWAVDNARFAGGDRAAARAELGLHDDVVYYLFSGTLIPRKRPLDVVEAISRLQRRGHRVGAIFAGTGELEDELRTRVERDGVRDVHLLGFVNQVDLPRLYAGADVFVLPSEKDPRGTVINEAMASGLPVVISTGTGVWGPGDLVRHGHEGFVHPIGDIDRLTSDCEALIDPERRADMATAASERIQVWSYETAALGWAQAAEGAVSRRRDNGA